MPNLVGADVAALRRFAAQCERHGHEIDDARRRLDATLHGVPWVGLDRQGFLDEWQRVHAVTLVAMAGELSAAARRASHHAARQEQASRSW